MSKDVATMVDAAPLKPQVRRGLTPGGNNGDVQMKSGADLAASALKDNGTLVSSSRPLIAPIAYRRVSDNTALDPAADFHVTMAVNGKTATLPAVPDKIGRAFRVRSTGANVNTIDGNGNNVESSESALPMYAQNPGETTDLVWNGTAWEAF